MSQAPTPELDVFDDPLGSALVYSKFMGRTLSDRVATMAGRSKIVSLLGELAVTRALACDAFESYEMVARLTPETSKLSASQIMTLKAHACDVVYTAMDRVKEMAVAAHKIMQREAMDPITAQTMIFQTVKVIDNKVQEIAPILQAAGRDPAEWMRQVALEVEGVRTPDPGTVEALDDGRLGSSLTPEAIDAELRAMYSSVPSLPFPAHNGQQNGEVA